MASLLDLFNVQTPTAIQGLLSPEEQQKLQQKAATTGLINMAVGYLAQPKNQRFGSALPYLARAYTAGQEGAQGTYDEYLKNWQQQQQVKQFQQAQEADQATQEALKTLSTRPEIANNPVALAWLKSDPKAALKAFATPPERKTSVVGGALVDEQGNVIYQAPEKPTEAWSEPYTLGGQTVQRSLTTGQIRQAVTAPAQTNVTVGKQETEEAKTVGKGFGEQYNEIQKAGIGAQRTIDRATRLNQLLTDVETGKLTPVGKEISATARSLGFKVNEKLPNLEAANALSNEMALELRNPSGGAGMPGALSDKDREFLVSMTPGIAQTPEGRKLITESMIKLARRNQEVAKIARDYRKRTGTLDEGFYAELEAFSAQNPLFETMKTQKAPRNKKDILKQYGIE